MKSDPLSILSGQPDEKLLALIKNGSEQAYAVIFRRYNQLLYTIAYKYLKNNFMAEDAVQTIFLKLWETRTVVQIEINLKNYLFTMLKHHVLNEIRNNNTAIQKNYELIQSSPAYENELLEKIEEKDLMTHFYKAINELPPQKKEVCLLKIQGNLSNQEIADRMHISVPTVKTHYAQSIKILRKQFGYIVLYAPGFSIFL